MKWSMKTLRSRQTPTWTFYAHTEKGEDNGKSKQKAMERIRICSAIPPLEPKAPSSAPTRRTLAALARSPPDSLLLVFLVKLFLPFNTIMEESSGWRMNARERRRQDMHSTKRQRWLKLGASAAAALLFGFLIPLYSFFAFMPTGFGEFAAASREAGDNAQALLSELARPMADPFMDSSESSSTLCAASAPDFLQSIADIEAPLWELSPHASAEAGPFFLLWPDADREADAFHCAVGDFEHLDGAARRPRLANSSIILKTAAMMLAQRQIDPHELAMREERFRLYESILPAALDKTEAFLLAEEWQPPVFHNFPGEANCDRFTQLAALAVARASLHDEQEKAEMLLERLLRVLAIVHIGRFPLAEWAYSHYLPPLFFWLGEERRISPEGWLKALQALDAALLPKERIGEMRAAHALRARDAAMKALEGRPVAMEPRWLCDALGGSIGQGIFAALRPLARSRAEALSLAYAKGENTKATANGVALGLLVDGPFYLQFADSGWQRHAGAQIESNSGLKREQGLELARLTAAAQLYRAQSGAEPRSLEDLTGMGFVAPADSQSPFPQVFWLDSNDPSLAAGGKKEFRARPVFCVHARWGPLPFDFDRNGEWIISLACWPGDLSIDGKGAKWLAEAPRPGAD